MNAGGNGNGHQEQHLPPTSDEGSSDYHSFGEDVDDEEDHEEELNERYAHHAVSGITSVHHGGNGHGLMAHVVHHREPLSLYPKRDR